MKHRLLCLLPVWLFLTGWVSNAALAQTTYTVTGRVIDAATGEGVPFASIALKGKAQGTTSDAEGRYSLEASQLTDSLVVSSLGYQRTALALTRQLRQVIDIRLAAAATRLQEVKVYAKGGDPAYRILREAMRRRDQFDPARLSAFQYESYTKMEAYVNNVRPKRKNGKGPGPVGKLLGKLPSILDENGQPAIPVFISETVSDYYERHDPQKTKERIRKNQVTAVGVTDGSLVAQLTGASFQQYNFYSNYLTIFRKDIPSPLGTAWQALYTFQLLDTVRVGESVCYEIGYEPKRATDLALTGTVWLDTTALGLVQVEGRIAQSANINFVDEIRVEQEYEATSSGHRLPVRTQLMIDTDELTPRSPGGLLRFYATAGHVVVNEPQDLKFYDPALELAEKYQEKDPKFWQTVRPDALSPEEMRTFEVVDSVRNVPFVKYTGELLKLSFNGYQPLGPLHLDLGPLMHTYANNTLEGHRIRLSLRTNVHFSRRWLLNGYLAYGTRDQRFKYGMGINYVLQKKPYTIMGVRHGRDLERIGINADNLGSNSLLLAYARFGNYRRPYFQEDYSGYIRRELGKGFTQTISLQTRTFQPLFPFAYRTEPIDRPETSLRTQYRTTEFGLETRFAPGELMIQDDNDRVNIGATNKPVLTLRYALGMKDVFHSDLCYHRLTADWRHSFRMGVLGRTYYRVNAGYTPSTLPYPLLFTPLGNESYFYVYTAYNLMNFFEFVTDRYASLHVEHNFEGLLFNRIPAIRRLKWRTLATARVLVGGVREDNLKLIPATDDTGRPVEGFRSLGQTPYVELGYGIDNIFKLLRVDGIHRLTYRSNPGVTPFAVKVSAYLSL